MLINSPERFWETFEENPPDLIVLDLDMPGISGLDLCRVVRNDPRWDRLPILFLTARTEPAIIQQLFAAGADDYVAKPVIEPEILTRVVNRLERARLQRMMAERDLLTGLANRYKAELVFDQFFRLAERQGVPVAMALLDVDRFKAINDGHGHAIADQVLQQLGQLLLHRFRGYDVAARWGGEEFVIGMFGVDRDFARQRLGEILDVFTAEEFVDGAGERFGVTFSAGVTEYPTDGTTLQDLYRTADAALYQAKAAGRARIFASNWRAEAAHVTRKVDVALVEDDHALAGLLLHTLATRGYQTEWFKDGEAAANALTSSQPDVRAQVVLLDVGLPSTDGFDVLRRMVDSGVTQRTRVIMLTAHATENEVLTALELGAFDHVSKPFSAPVLLQRIRRAMNSERGCLRAPVTSFTNCRGRGTACDPGHHLRPRALAPLACENRWAAPRLCPRRAGGDPERTGRT
jgi:diguanylate cyclase (GGDEF)-like protein